MRLDKYIARSGIATRSEAKKLIKSGAVAVNGEMCRSADAKIADTDAVTVNGKLLTYREFVYLMLNKPAGYVSATEDKKYPVVTDLVPPEYAPCGVFPAGRLDIDTEGLLILTNDGKFAHDMTSPKKNVYKRYFARLDSGAEESDVDAFALGMEFKEFTAKPARLEITENPCEVYIEIAEGKFHQVKRMCERVGKSVIYLKRVKIGELELDKSLGLGEMRELTQNELNKINKNTTEF